MQQILTEFERIKTLVGIAGIDLAKFVDGNKAAGTRLRKQMLDVRNGANEIRKLVSEIKNEGTYKLGGK